MESLDLIFEDDAVSLGLRHRLPTSRTEACRILKEIRDENGHLDADEIRKVKSLDEKFGRKVVKGFRTLRKEKAKFTKKISEEIYSTKYRFIYELLQNADDALHNSGEKPFVIFNLYPDRLVVDTNEDGFTIADVIAISRSGESSKSTSQESKPIGEKGFGFKSVFAIAHQVRIQSGFWSFYFKNQEGDDGIGMITPINIDPEDLPSGITRITLTLGPGSNDTYTQLIEELNALPDTITMFLQSISELTFIVHEPDQPMVSTKISARPDSSYSNSKLQKLVVTEKTTKVGEGKDGVRMDMIRKRYMWFQKKLDAMPLERRRWGMETSKVQLAFPLCSEDFQPLIDQRGQYINAYLPICRVAQIPFVIQADFVTNASRESVLGDSKWNRRLLDGVAQTFSTAIESFYDDEEMRYLWMRYVPGHHLDGFWQPLRAKIQDELKELKILESWLRQTPSCLSQLKIVPGKYTHNGKPLFDDLKEEKYLTPKYKPKDLRTLRDLGVKTLTPSNFVYRLRRDKSLPIYKKIPEDSWHTSLYTALLDILDDKQQSKMHKEINKLKLIPLRRELQVDESPEEIEEDDKPSWISATKLKADDIIVFPHSNLIRPTGSSFSDLEPFPIPKGIYQEGLSVVWPPAVVESQRRIFLERMGVIDIEPEHIIDGIRDFHLMCHEQELPPTLQTVIPHLRYIFRFYTCDLAGLDYLFWVADDLSSFRVNDKENGYRQLYFKTKGKQSTWDLLKSAPKTIRHQYASFIHDDIVAAEGPKTTFQGRSWQCWLKESGPITTVPPLSNQETRGCLSPILSYVTEHQNEKFLPVLKEHWESTYSHEVAATPALITTIRNTKVICKNGRHHALCETYLPRADVAREATRIDLAQELPLLNLPTASDTDNWRDWDFLIQFGVKNEIDLGFYAAALRILSSFEADDERITPAASKIYGAIGKMCSLEMQEEVEAVFQSQNLIYTPQWAPAWQVPKDCRWEAPVWLSDIPSLAESYSDDPGACHLFRTALAIPDADFDDYLAQLGYLKYSELDRSDMIAECLEIYNEFNQADINKLDIDWDHVRTSFESGELIITNGDWHAPSTCLWSSGIAISTRVTIADFYGDYGDFEHFFVNVLGVKTADSAMVIDELIRRTKERNLLTCDQAKSILREISRLMVTEKIDKRLKTSLTHLSQTKFLPVRVGQNDPNLVDISTDFAIADHKRYDDALRPHAAFLDFTLEEIQELHPLIKGLGLRSRYLSQSVKETSVITGDLNSNDTLTKELQARAYAFYCCAIKYKSSKAVGHDQYLYEKLGQLQVYETDGIVTSMSLVQNEKKIEVASKRIRLRLEDLTKISRLESNSKTAGTRSGKTSDSNADEFANSNGRKDPASLSDSDSASSTTRKRTSLYAGRANRPGELGTKIFVPADAHERRKCYRTQLPGDILTILGINNTEALLPINRLLNLQHESLSERDILEEHDIPLVSWIHPPNSIFEKQESSADTGASEPEQTAWTDDETSSESHTSSEASLQDNSIQEARAVKLTRNTPLKDQVGTYRQLLGHIIGQVSRSFTAGDTDMRTSWSVKDWLDDPPESVNAPRTFDKTGIFGIRSENQLAHDMKIGAAGELFVFETLLRVHAEGFGLDNWESSIRHLVNVHPRYANIKRRTRTEQADLIYVDTEGKLLDWLLQQEPTGIETLLTRPTVIPKKYFIEVKTTTKGRDEVFHMSNAQKKRMRNMHERLDHDEVPQNVYLIFRVYNLLSNDINMDIYVSPWRPLEADEKILQFRAKGWEVWPAT